MGLCLATDVGMLPALVVRFRAVEPGSASTQRCEQPTDAASAATFGSSTASPTLRRPSPSSLRRVRELVDGLVDAPRLLGGTLLGQAVLPRRAR